MCPASIGSGLYTYTPNPILQSQNKKVRDIPVKPPLLAMIKSNNYLINALTCEEAEDHVRARLGVEWVGGSTERLTHPH